MVEIAMVEVTLEEVGSSLSGFTNFGGGDDLR